MKKSLLIIVLFVMSGCSMVNNIFNRNNNVPKEKFSVDKNIILFDGKPYAELQAMTWSLDGGELVREMNFKLLDKEDLNIIGGMINFLSERHQGDEIEVEFNIEHNSERFKL